MVAVQTVQLQEILDKFLDGDAKAKAELINHAESRLMTLARKLLRGFGSKPDETAAIVSECYLKLHKALDDVRPGTVRQFFGLASLQMRRVLLDLVRGNRGNKNIGGDDTDNQFDPTGDGTNVSHVDLITDLYAAIDKLDEELREIVHLLYIQGLTQAEVGQLIGVHEDTVKRKWAKARVVLAKHLAAFDPKG